MKPDTETAFDLNVSPEFIAEGIKNSYRPHKNGPYTKDEKIKRQSEVYKLHFEYGYSARKISELMRVNRNTINSDIQYWYSKVGKEFETMSVDDLIMKIVGRLEIQRTRLREMLDKTEDFQQKITIEKMLFDIESKMAQINLKVLNFSSIFIDGAVSYINKWMTDNGHQNQVVSRNNMIKVSKNAAERINKIIAEDRKKAKHITY